MSLPTVVELVTVVKTGWDPVPPEFVSVALVLSVELSVALVELEAVISLPVSREVVELVETSRLLVVRPWFVSVS